MTNKEVLAELVKTVKDAVKKEGGKLNQEEMADSLGITRSYLSDLIKGPKPVSDQFLAFFREKFKRYLPDTNAVTREDMIILRTSIGVILRSLAKLQTKLPMSEDASKYLRELKLEIQLISTEKQVSEQALKDNLESL